MELMDTNLYSVLRQRSLSISESKKIGLDICRGMYYLVSHQPPIYHRDLKSQNVLLDLHSMKARLTDFGLSKVKNFTMSSLSRVGTPQWSAPEVLDSEKSIVDYEKADVYSFGGK